MPGPGVPPRAHARSIVKQTLAPYLKSIGAEISAAELFRMLRKYF
ncbi:hypothetical protein BCEN4_350176 [Burkholderia cenocepacia]|nr:hypothetical protein BCEN4_350176 [Burkholderia cenocepacia]